MGRWQLHYRIADCAIVLRGFDARLQALAASLYEGARCETVEPDIRFDLASDEGRLSLQREGDASRGARSCAELFQAAEWRLTEAFMEGLGAYCQFHAAVAVHRGRAIVLCGAPEAGKTSLVVGLALAGADFYSDEVALFDPERFDVHPFRRDLIVHRGTQKLFPELETNLPAWKVFSDYCYVPPRAVGASAAGGGAPCGALVFPVRKPGAAARWSVLGQTEAAGRLLEQSFNLWDRGEDAIEVIGRLVETCPARELVFGDAREAAALLLASEV